MSTPERFTPTLRHKRKPGYDRGPDMEINRPLVKYFGPTEADDHTEVIPLVQDGPAWSAEETRETAKVQPPAASQPFSTIPRSVERFAWGTALLLVGSCLFTIAGIIAWIGVDIWRHVL